MLIKCLCPCTQRCNQNVRKNVFVFFPLINLNKGQQKVFEGKEKCRMKLNNINLENRGVMWIHSLRFIFRLMQRAGKKSFIMCGMEWSGRRGRRRDDTKRVKYHVKHTILVYYCYSLSARSKKQQESR